MQANIAHIPFSVSKYELKRAIASIVHSDEFPKIRRTTEEEDEDEELDGRLNFEVELNPSKIGGAYGDGSGFIIFAGPRERKIFLDFVRKSPIRIKGKPIKFYPAANPHGNLRGLSETLSKTRYVDPTMDEEREHKCWLLSEVDLRVCAVQFGIFYSPYYPKFPIPLPNRQFSKEWEQNYLTAGRSLGWLRFEYDHKLIRITLGDDMTQPTGYNIVITFANIHRIAVGFDGNPYLCFDTHVPPMLTEIDFHRPVTGNESQDSSKFRRRIAALDDGHARVAPFAHKIRFELYNDSTKDVIEEFQRLAVVAGLSKSLIVEAQVEASGRHFFSPKQLFRIDSWLKVLDWPIAFQVESLLRSSLVHTEDLLGDLRIRINKLIIDHPGDGGQIASQILVRFGQALITRSARESPVACLDRVIKAFVTPPQVHEKGLFMCCHVTFTPTRTVLEGPYASQSNRIIRQYSGYDHNFVRVDFKDEDQMQYRWDRDVDGAEFLINRVGGTLKQGFDLAGRHFEFLAYSNSALREHAVWFICPFEFPMHQEWGSPVKVYVNADFIRSRIGNFENTELLKQPSKYAARLAQAFTATNPSVSLLSHEWEVVYDLGTKPYLHTDGCGTISKILGDRMWAALCANRRDEGRSSVQPSAYQIRFLGYKGIVSVDENLEGPKHMLLRPSMEKFMSSEEAMREAQIEVARAFEAPNVTYLNRPLVMVLEDRKVKKEEFTNLQEESVREARTIHDSVPQFRAVLKAHNLGRGYRLLFILEKLEALGLEFVGMPGSDHLGIEDPFLHRLRHVAMTSVLRDIKHGARIRVPNSFTLVGVADEGPAYVDQGRRNVYSLPQGYIYACVHLPTEEPKWLQGRCLVSRSPVVHPGDIQRVHAIGKPPDDVLCSFRNKKNVVVFSSLGNRSLASCCAGGDLDGDIFDIIQYSPLFLSDAQEPAEYPAGEPLTLDRPSTVDDIADFIVSYISSDVLGLLSDRHLVIADQSKRGTRDPNCLTLAELCSQAVDYPKNGVPVNIDDLPRTLIRCKPDWHAAEVVSPRQTDYYRSDKALGRLFRAITLEEFSPLDMKSSSHGSLSDPISQALEPLVQIHLQPYWRPDGTSTEVKLLLKRYVHELSYICSTHTVSNTPGAKLLEHEVVVGTILAKCPQKRWRTDRMFRMRTTASVLVREVQSGLLENADEKLREILCVSLRKAWDAWDLSKRQVEFGSYSFGLIALGIIFDLLDKLD